MDKPKKKIKFIVKPKKAEPPKKKKIKFVVKPKPKMSTTLKTNFHLFDSKTPLSRKTPPTAEEIKKAQKVHYDYATKKITDKNGKEIAKSGSKSGIYLSIKWSNSLYYSPSKAPSKMSTTAGASEKPKKKIKFIVKPKKAEPPKKSGDVLKNQDKLVGKILGIHDKHVYGSYYGATFRKIVALKNGKVELIKSDATGKPIMGRTGKETKTKMTLEKLKSHLENKEKRNGRIYEPTPESMRDSSRAMALGGKDGEATSITNMFV